MRKYWLFLFLINDKERTRYFYGTETAVVNRVKRTTGERKQLEELTKYQVNYLKKKNANFIKL